MQTRLIIIHEVNPRPAKPAGATRTTVSPAAAGTNGVAHWPKRSDPAGARRRSGSDACDSRRLVFVNWLPGRLIRCTGGMIAAAFLVAGATLRADTPTASFDQANAAYSEGRYAEAARGFESVLAERGFSAAVLYNLANAQMGEGRLGSAILNYERARTLAPADPDIAANLKLARIRAGTATPNEPGSRWTQFLSLDAWGGLAAAALLVTGTAAVLGRRRRRGAIAIRFAGAAAGALFLASLAMLTLRGRELNRAIVVAAECPLRISPTSVGEQLFPLHGGDAVTLRRTRGEYAFVQARNGRAGWVKRSDIGRVYAVSPK